MNNDTNAVAFLKRNFFIIFWVVVILFFGSYHFYITPHPDNFPFDIVQQHFDKNMMNCEILDHGPTVWGFGHQYSCSPSILANLINFIVFGIYGLIYGYIIQKIYKLLTPKSMLIKILFGIILLFLSLIVIFFLVMYWSAYGIDFPQYIFSN